MSRVTHLLHVFLFTAAGVFVAIAASRADEAPTVRVPSYFDANARIEKPNLSTIRVIRFATGNGYPPFHYADADGRPVGYAVDVARAVCVELAIPCTMQAFRWEVLLDTIDKEQADAIVAMIRPSEQLLDRFTPSDRFYQPMARFVGRADTALKDANPETLAGRTVGVLAQTGHEEYLRAVYPETQLKAFVRAEDARAALRAGAVELVFGDSAALAVWLNGSSSEKCCRFVGDAFIEPRFFGDGVGILTAKSNDVLARAISYALRQIDQKRVLADIYLRHFPLGFY